MSQSYKSTWDLSTIPEDAFNAERGRRHRAKAPRITNVNYQPCAKCSKPLTTTERRKPCPHCGYKHPRESAK